jgi:Uma2 family endonuclease
MALVSAVFEYPQHHAISAQEYLRMGEAGVFSPDARLELIEGEIIEMAPIGSAHAGAVNVLTRLFVQLAGDRAVVSVQNPLVLGNRSVPQPDLTLLRSRNDSYSRTHPAAADVLLIVEVSDSTLAFDTGTKVPLYARKGVPEVWVIDLRERVVRVYRDPGASGYKTDFRAAGDEQLAALAMPELVITPAELFGD